MSPPCQPHTRQHSNNGEEDLHDPRSASFLHLIRLLSKMSSETLPQLIVLENVVGFESSASCSQWQNVLAQRQYSIGQWHVSPTMVGIPNDRPRYYCVAIRNFEASSSISPPVLSERQSTEATGTRQADHKNQSLFSSYFHMETSNLDTTTTSDNYLQLPLLIHTQLKELDVVATDDSSSSEAIVDAPSQRVIAPISTYLDPSSSHDEDDDDNHDNHHHHHPNHDLLRIPPKLLQSNASWCFDIVTPFDQRSSCFTHSYGKYIKGTGSILYDYDSRAPPPNTNDPPLQLLLPLSLQLQRPDQRIFNSDWAKELDTTRLRYFSGRELARLFGFPTTFSFPPSCTMKQQWKVMGNSLNVRLSARLVEIGLRVLLIGGSVRTRRNDNLHKDQDDDKKDATPPPLGR
jgi:tRNA (cytosine38-C5)-methyltransferase